MRQEKKKSRRAREKRDHCNFLQGKLRITFRKQTCIIITLIAADIKNSFKNNVYKKSRRLHLTEAQAKTSTSTISERFPSFFQ
jgi:hypothetical protein